VHSLLFIVKSRIHSTVAIVVIRSPERRDQSIRRDHDVAILTTLFEQKNLYCDS